MRIRGVSLLVLLVLLCSGCGRSRQTGEAGADNSADGALPQIARPDAFRVAMLTFEPFSRSIANEWNSFQSETGCKLTLDVRAMDRRQLYQTLFTAKGLKQGDWDVVLVDSDWLAEGQRTGVLLDLTADLQKSPPEDYPGDWWPSSLQLQQIGPRVLGLPYHGGPMCLLYRKDMLEDSTLSMVYRAEYRHAMPVPATWDEFARVAEFLDRPEKRLYGTGFAAAPDARGMVYDICLQVATRGGQVFDARGNLRPNTPEMIETLAFYRRMLDDKFAVHPRCREFDSVALGNAFLAGEVVMMVDGFGYAAACETDPRSKVKGLVGVAPVPHGRSATSRTLSRCWALAVAADSPHKDVAYQFLRDCMSRAADRRRTLAGALGCRKSTWTDAEVRRNVPVLEQIEPLRADAVELPRLANWMELSDAIDRMATDAIGTEKPLAAIAAEAQQKSDGRREGR